MRRECSTDGGGRCKIEIAVQTSTLHCAMQNMMTSRERAFPLPLEILVDMTCHVESLCDFFSGRSYTLVRFFLGPRFGANKCHV